MLPANDFYNMLPRFDGDAQSANQAMVDGLGALCCNQRAGCAQLVAGGCYTEAGMLGIERAAC